jgi:superfamily I DNA and RNA helicase
MSHDVGLAQMVSRAKFRLKVMGSIPGRSNFVKHFCFTAENNYVVITINYDEKSYDVIRNSEPRPRPRAGFPV